MSDICFDSMIGSVSEQGRYLEQVGENKAIGNNGRAASRMAPRRGNRVAKKEEGTSGQTKKRGRKTE